MCLHQLHSTFNFPNTNAALTLQEQDNPRIQEVREYAAKDDVYQSLKHVIFNGFTNQRGQITHPLKNSEESRTI